MCGIVGLFLKDPALQSSLGRFTAAMLATLTDRGPDSAGFAVYGEGTSGAMKLTLRGPDPTELRSLTAVLEADDLQIALHDDHAVLTVPSQREQEVRDRLATRAPQMTVVGSGQRMELYKGVGLPLEVSARFGLADMRGTHAIGHTRMATESAVTTAGAHPFSTGPDQCLVHNGSLSNHNGVRRMMQREHIAFETDNDTEVAARYLSWRMHQGARLDEALEAALIELDGFYTFVVGTASGFGVLRDPIACKPAIIAETDGYVAFGSEYRALVDLPDIADAYVFEPTPARVYFWEHRT
jgi:methylamine---glutamate N-methyltransferase subunit A